VKLLCEKCGNVGEAQVRLAPEGDALILRCLTCGGEQRQPLAGTGTDMPPAPAPSPSPPLDDAPPPSAPPSGEGATAAVLAPDDQALTEAEAWSRVLVAWNDEAAHKAYLARFRDLEGLAMAGQRYREAIEKNPKDPVPQRWRDELLKRATAQAFAQIPRTKPDRGAPRWIRTLLILVLAAGCIGLIATIVSRMAQLGQLGNQP
jgi:hypothetical protein